MFGQQISFGNDLLVWLAPRIARRTSRGICACDSHHRADWCVSLSGIFAKLREPGDTIDEHLTDLDLRVLGFNRDQAMRAGK